MIVAAAHPGRHYGGHNRYMTYQSIIPYYYEVVIVSGTAAIGYTTAYMPISRNIALSHRPVEVDAATF